MGKFSITFADDVTVEIESVNGTQAKADARLQRGLKKSACKITRVEPVAEPAAADPPAEPFRAY